MQNFSRCVVTCYPVVMSMIHLPPELIGRIVDSLDVSEPTSGLAVAYAACVCRAWSAEVDTTWQLRATRTLPTEVADLDQAPAWFTRTRAMRDADWVSGPGTLRINSGAPAAPRDMCRAWCAARECSDLSLGYSFSDDVFGLVDAGGPQRLCLFYGAGRLGSGFSEDISAVLGRVAGTYLPRGAYLELEQKADAVLDALLDALATRIRTDLLASEEPASFDALMRIVENLLPADLSSAAVSEIESATAHMGHTPDARTQRNCLFGSSSAGGGHASTARFAGCEAVMTELMRLLEFLCEDLLDHAWLAQRDAVAQQAVSAAGSEAGPSSADTSEGDSDKTLDVRCLKLPSLVAALRDEAWAALCADLFAEPQPGGSDDVATWVAAAAAAPPLSSAGTGDPGAICIDFTPLSIGALDAAAHVAAAHARHVNGPGVSVPQEEQAHEFEVEDVTIPLALPLARAIVERLEAWGASRVAFMHLAVPDPDDTEVGPRGEDSAWFFPSFIAGELQNGMLAGVAFVHRMGG